MVLISFPQNAGFTYKPSWNNMIELTDNMDAVMAKMSEKDDKAASIITNMWKEYKSGALHALLLLDSRSIRGIRLVKAFDFCKSNDLLLFNTLRKYQPMMEYIECQHQK